MESESDKLNLNPKSDADPNIGLDTTAVKHATSSADGSKSNNHACSVLDGKSGKIPEQHTGCKASSSNLKADSATEEELEYESEPTSIVSLENRPKRKLSLKESQGKTMYPPLLKTSARELKELTRKHLKLEKSLKIEGIPDLPKIRKRRMSTGANLGRDKDSLYKRRRLMSLSVDRPKKGHMPNWGSLGGDATDPLNLNGLATSEEGRLLNLKTPENSPLPTPDFRKIVYVKVPPNIEDPLNLEGKHDQNYIDMLLNSTRKKRHRSKKNKDHVINQTKDIKVDMDINLSANENTVNSNEDKGQKIKEPSPVPVQSTPPVPTKQKSEQSTPQKQAGAVSNRSRSRSLSTSPDRRVKRQLSGLKGYRPVIEEPKKFPEKPMFTLGNYNRYYGYRNCDQEHDPRLRFFNPQLFENKDVLDIGCNVGHVTLAIAQHFHPRKILGMDIDGKLIKAARQNMRHMLSQRRKDSSKYPFMLEMIRGPLEAHPLTDSSNKFPNNILFLQGNYVPGSEEILQLQKEEYDTILALSITKWIQLNNGDHGLKLFFQKIARQLRPGGHLILEPQPWPTYKKRAKLTPDMFKHYSSIKLKPEGFKNYLLSIGFVKCEVIGVPVTKAKGFRRPLILFTKADRSNSSSVSATASLPICTECPLMGSQAECDHVQSTGVRRGAYADRLYDHISYHPSMRTSDMNGASSSSAGRGFSVSSPAPASFMLESTYSPMDVPPFYPASFSPNPNPRHSSRSDYSSGTGDQQASGSCRSSSSGSGSSSQSSSHSSGSGSSYTESSSPLVNGDLAHAQGVAPQPPMPQNNGPRGLNGDIADEIVWVNNEAADEDRREEDGYILQDNDMSPSNGDV